MEYLIWYGKEIKLQSRKMASNQVFLILLDFRVFYLIKKMYRLMGTDTFCGIFYERNYRKSCFF